MEGTFVSIPSEVEGLAEGAMLKPLSKPRDPGVGAAEGPPVLDVGTAVAMTNGALVAPTTVGAAVWPKTVGAMENIPPREPGVGAMVFTETKATGEGV